MKDKVMKAYHFITKTSDGKFVTSTGHLPVIVGETLKFNGPLELCKNGLHASIKPLDALSYAQDNILCRVECQGEIIHGSDKLVCSERTVLWMVDAEPVLRKFARLCALDVIDLWEAPEIVKKYLRTGDETIRDAAGAAAWAAAARAAAWSAARSVAGAAARAAAWSAAWDAAAGTAARSVARAAAGTAAWDAAGAAAWYAARTKQNKRLARMLREAKRIE